ncbi:hypothetical protein CQA86_32390, partial [Klebsiella pneumoniae]
AGWRPPAIAARTALDHFLGSLDGLINLLPLTAQTRPVTISNWRIKKLAGVHLLSRRGRRSTTFLGRLTG